MDTPQPQTLTAPRLAAVQRIYLYLVTLVSFIAALVAADRLALVLDQAWLSSGEFQPLYTNPYLRDAVAGRGGVLLVATPIFLLHWHMARVRQDQSSFRASALRKLFFYIAMAISVGYVMVYAYQLLKELFQLTFGAPLELATIWPSGWLYRLLMLIVAVTLQGFFYYTVRADGDYGIEQGRTGTVRRLYQAIAGLVALVLLISGTATVLETIWNSLATADIVVGDGWWRTPTSAGLAQLIVGGLLARYNWRRWQTILAIAPAEATTFLRRLFLYVSVVIAAIATLVPAAELLRELLLRLFDPSNADWSDLITQTASPISLIPPGLTAWIWYARHIRREATAFEDSPEADVVHRIYNYAVAATGIVLLWFGASAIIQAIVDWLVTVQAERLWAEPLATGLSLLTVGAPIWSYHWRLTQKLAKSYTPAGLTERTSLPRRIYLYAIALTGALLILYYFARVAYRLLLLLLGDPDAALLSGETAEEIARAVITTIFWLVHVLAIRTDANFEDSAQQAAVQTQESQPALDVRREQLRATIAQLEADLVQAREELARLDSLSSENDSAAHNQPRS